MVKQDAHRCLSRLWPAGAIEAAGDKLMDGFDLISPDRELLHHFLEARASF